MARENVFYASEIWLSVKTWLKSGTQDKFILMAGPEVRPAGSKGEWIES